MSNIKNEYFIYDNYEISGRYCIDEKGKPDRVGKYTVPCDDRDAYFWTLYGHIDGQGVEAIGDFSSREDAEQVYFRITGEPYTSL